jgi:hypothetical protein
VNPDHDPKKRLVFGCSGSGKSTKFRQLMNVGGYRWVYVFDWDLKYARSMGLQAAGSVKGLCELQDANKPVLFYPRHIFPDLEEGFAFFCRFILEQAKGRQGKKLVGCDELQECIPSNFSSLAPAVREIINYGRNEEIDFVFTAQNLMGLNSRLKAQTTEIYIFRHSDLDESGFKKFQQIGIDPEQVKRLPHPSVDGRVGWIYKHMFTGKTEFVTHGINRPTKASR